MAEPYLSSKEIWKQVVGWENWYSVSDWGRVRRDAPGPSTWVGRILRGGFDSDGYLFVVLSKLGKQRICYVHALVAAAFIGPKPEGLEINHKNTNKLDNRPENLEYITHDQNVKHAVACGLIARGDRHGSRTHPERTARGERHCRAKLTNKDVLEIRKLLSEGVFQKVIAEKFGVGRRNIGDIKTRKNWVHLL